MSYNIMSDEFNEKNGLSSNEIVFITKIDVIEKMNGKIITSNSGTIV